VSGRITPTVPFDDPLEPGDVAVLLLLPPQAVRASVHSAPTAARLAHFDVAIDCPLSLLGRALGAVTPVVTTLTPYVVNDNITG
jgi:hypothetical protein